MADLEQLVATYGYLAVFVGAFFEGETILILGALAANRGLLLLPWVVLAGFMGSLLGDQLWFYLARRYGNLVLCRYPSWRLRIERALRLLDRHNTLFILSFRFFYGLRTVSSFAVGLTHVGSLRYLVLNTIGALVWAVVLGYAGFLLGEALRHFINKIELYEQQVLIAIVVLAFSLWLFRILRDRHRCKASE